METLTKENFWNALTEKYPGEMANFNVWIDKYKESIGWVRLFNGGRLTCARAWDGNGYDPSGETVAPKFHDLPMAMQIGIFLQFVAETDTAFGVEINVEYKDDFFEKIPEAIKEFFFHEHDDAVTDHQNGKYMDDAPGTVEGTDSIHLIDYL